IGLRPGEKLYEELIIDGENIVPTSHKKIMVLRGLSCHLGQLNGSIDELAKLAHEQDSRGIREKLEKIVPEYKPTSHTSNAKVVPLKRPHRATTGVTSQDAYPPSSASIPPPQ
ncbi:MAG: polysaccharide biosynthesis protein, partial [Deltaproteobacteria bacterium]|nr:polysaccharide biosynthesis protein [Deltaproteobacteria bacterium]